ASQNQTFVTLMPIEQEKIDITLASKQVSTPVDATPGHTHTASAHAVLVAVFSNDSNLVAGQYANNAWLQELPRPYTKITWDNAALISPRTAERHGLRSGD